MRFRRRRQEKSSRFTSKTVSLSNTVNRFWNPKVGFSTWSNVGRPVRDADIGPLAFYISADEHRQSQVSKNIDRQPWRDCLSHHLDLQGNGNPHRRSS